MYFNDAKMLLADNKNVVSRQMCTTIHSSESGLRSGDLLVSQQELAQLSRHRWLAVQITNTTDKQNSGIPNTPLI